MRYSCAIVVKFGVNLKCSVSIVYGNPSSGNHTESMQIDGQKDGGTNRLIPFHSKGALLWQLYVIDNKKLFMPGTRYWCQNLTKFLLFFFEWFSQKFSVSNITDIRPMRVALIYATRRTDMTELIGASRGFANASKNSCGPQTFEFLNFWSTLKTWTRLGESNVPTHALQVTENR